MKQVMTKTRIMFAKKNQVNKNQTRINYTENHRKPLT